MDVKKHYSAFNSAIIRTPAYPLDEAVLNLTSIEAFWEKFQKDAYFSEAVFLASPDLYREMRKFSRLPAAKLLPKLRRSILKYAIRMHTRATPFGLFSGVGLLQTGETTSLEPAFENYVKRRTRLDMHYLVHLSQKLSQTEEIQSVLQFFPNTSLYRIGDELRYVEYYYENTKRVHETVSIETNAFIEKILKKAQQGATIAQLAQSLVSADITYDEAEVFVKQLIAHQILVSELEPQLTGEEQIDQLINRLQNKKIDKKYVQKLYNLKKHLQRLDKNHPNTPEEYEKLMKELSAFPVTFNEKFLFQTDVFLNFEHNCLSATCIDTITDCIDFLASLSEETPSQTLQSFGQKLYRRFENQAVPLSLALDSELGIPLDSALGSQTISSLLDDLPFPPDKGQEPPSLILTPRQKILWQKWQEAYRLQKDAIVLNRQDFKDIPPKKHTMPDTFSAMLQLVNDRGDIKPYVVSAGGNSAGNLIARFGFLHPELHAYLQEIARKEAGLHPDKVTAEIVHLPEARVGNILMRPRFRDYEIPYLAQASVPLEKQIKIEDLYIIADAEGKIRLFSKKHGKEVIPKLTNAHNYHLNALPVYHFLSLYQSQNQINNWSFSWGGIAQLVDFLPRVYYKNTILHPAKWKISPAETARLTAIKDQAVLMNKIKEYLDQRGIPQFILWGQGDNKLLINMHNPFHVDLWLHEIRRQKEFWIEEFLHHSMKTPVQQGANFFMNEIIIGYYKK